MNKTSFLSSRKLTIILVVLLTAALVLWLQTSYTSNVSKLSEALYSTHTLSTHQTYRGPRVSFGNVEILVEVADTQQEQAQGLSDRDMLPEGWGMLFVFDRPGRHSFWMYRMRFPLDIIWIGENGKVVHLVENAQPCPANGPCPPYDPPEDALYVVEVNAGFAEKHGVHVGSVVQIHFRS